VIVGGGFGGLNAALALARAPVEVTLLDKRNFHLFQPLLYQVATGGLSPANIAAPLRSVLRGQKNVTVQLADVQDFDLDQQTVLTDSGQVVYDFLILATGSRHQYFGNPQWEGLAPGLKTIEDATEIRRRVLLGFEQAERATDPAEVARHMTFVVIGGGPTGVELAGAIAEMARHTLRGEFRKIDSRAARVVLLENQDRILPVYPTDLTTKAVQALERIGVEVRTGCRVTRIEPGAVTILAEGKEEILAAETVLWAAGMLGSPLGAKLAKAASGETDRAGRVVVGPDCSLSAHQNVFVIGDLAHFQQENEQPLPAVAPVAIQQGQHVARQITRRLNNLPAEPFRYIDRGSMATIGRAAAVAVLGGWHLTGFLAWLAWLFVHLMLLVGHENRILVFVQWAWNYWTRNRSARLITGDFLPEVLPPKKDSATF